jgi:ketosteroid isomerase-like protein
MKPAVVVLGLLLALQSHGQAMAAQEDPAHDELRGLLKEFIAVYNSGEYDKLISYFTDNVVITWQNAHVDKSPQEVKAFCEMMTRGPNRRVEQSTIAPEADALSLLYNDGRTAVAYGHSNDHFKLRDGTEFDQYTRWSSTLVKQNGKWKVAGVHISANMFDNPVLTLAVRATALWAGGTSAAAGMIIGFLISWLVSRRKVTRISP